MTKSVNKSRKIEENVCVFICSSFAEQMIMAF